MAGRQLQERIRELFDNTNVSLALVVNLRDRSIVLKEVGPTARAVPSQTLVDAYIAAVAAAAMPFELDAEVEEEGWQIARLRSHSWEVIAYRVPMDVSTATAQATLGLNNRFIMISFVRS